MSPPSVQVGGMLNIAGESAISGIKLVNTLDVHGTLVTNLSLFLTQNLRMSDLLVVLGH